MSNTDVILAPSLDKREYYLRRYTKARVTSDLWISLLEACYHYTTPERNLYYWTSQYQGAQKNAKVYDTTPVIAMQSFVSKVHRALTPPQQNWALLEAGSEIPDDEKDNVNKLLQDSTNILFSYLHRSNFDLVINECYYDLGIGTACLIINEGPDEEPLRFFSVPLARLAPEQTYSGLLDAAWRWWDEVKISDILALWPEARLTPMMSSMLKDDPGATVKVLVDGCIDNSPYNTKTKYTYVVMHEGEILLEKAVDRNPFLTFRWSKISNEVMGRGPVIGALPSILTLNELMRLELTSANMNVAKPIMAWSDGIFNPWTFKLEPNTIIPIAPNTSGQFPLQPFPDTANPQFMQLTANDLRMQINKLMYGDPLGPIDAPAKTALEIATRKQEFLEQIGPSFTRLCVEFMPRLIENVIHILQKKGLMPKLNVNGKEIKLKYKSPITISQGQNDVSVFTQWFQLMQAIVGPDAAITYLNPIEMPMWMAEKMGVEMKILNDRAQMQEMLKQQSQQMEQVEALGIEQMGAQIGA